MIIPPKALFCLNVNTTLNKWSEKQGKWKATESEKEFILPFFNLPGAEL